MHVQYIATLVSMDWAQLLNLRLQVTGTNASISRGSFFKTSMVSGTDVMIQHSYFDQEIQAQSSKHILIHNHIPYLSQSHSQGIFQLGCRVQLSACEPIGSKSEEIHTYSVQVIVNSVLHHWSLPSLSILALQS